MLILITGIGITGKSSFRRNLVGILRSLGLKTEHFDADKFTDIRDPRDKDCLKELPQKFEKGIFYIIEDIHATAEKSVLPLKSYDLIFHLDPDFLSHVRLWLNRMKFWYLSGKFSWEPETGWKGSGNPKDPMNVIPILKEFYRDMYSRRKWIEQDIEKISCHNYISVKPCWKRGNIQFKILF